MTDHLTPERAVRLLRAKAADIEQQALNEAELHGLPLRPVTAVAVDLALTASILADSIEDLTAQIAALEDARHYHTATGKALTDADIEALADEAERGYDVAPMICRAARWNGIPVFDGDHERHFFTYGDHGEYTGSCAGWPKPDRERP